VTKIEARKGLTVERSLRDRFGNLGKVFGRAIGAVATTFSTGLIYVSSDAHAFSGK
jgi:hypothetical protein